ncbi:MAG: MarR family winged helix-turn-helix transcriptional regulator [Brachymonas sp.]
MSLHVSIEIFDALHELLRIFRTRMRQSLESVSPDLTFGELRVLMHVGEHPDCAQKALVERCHVDKAQMARLLAQLEDKGWLTRSESTKDRRVRQLHLSTQGQRLFRQLGARRAELAAELLKDCPGPVQSQLLELLAQARDSALQAPSTDS